MCIYPCLPCYLYNLHILHIFSLLSWTRTLVDKAKDVYECLYVCELGQHQSVWGQSHQWFPVIYIALITTVSGVHHLELMVQVHNLQHHQQTNHLQCSMDIDAASYYLQLVSWCGRQLSELTHPFATLYLDMKQAENSTNPRLISRTNRARMSATGIAFTMILWYSYICDCNVYRWSCFFII